MPRGPRAGHELQRQGSNLRLAVNSRASYRLDYAGTIRVAPAGLEPAPSRVRAGRSADSELRSLDVAGRDRTCGAPRFGRALYPLSYGHVYLFHHASTFCGFAAVERVTGRQRRSRFLPHVSTFAASPPSRRSGRGWDRTSGLLCVRQALCRLSYSPWIRDKDSNPDLHVQSVASFRVRRSRSVPASPRTPGSTGVRAAARQAVLSVPSSTSPTVFSKPLAYPSTLDRLPPSCAQPTEPSYVERSWSPIAARRVKNVMQKPMHLSKRTFHSRTRRALSLSGGASIRSSPCPS